MRSGSLPRNSPNAERLHPTTPEAVAGTVAASPTPPQNPNPAAGDEIPEADVLFDDATGHAHAGSGGSGTPVGLAGDVTGDNTAAVVVALQGSPVGAGAPNVGDLLIWDGSAWTPTAPTVATTKFQVSSWYASNISTRGAAAEMDSAGAPLPRQLMLADGNVLGIGILLESDIGGVGVSYKAELYKNGVATGHFATVTGAAGTELENMDISFTQAFIRTDILTVYDTLTGVPNSVRAAVFLLIQFT